MLEKQRIIRWINWKQYIKGNTKDARYFRIPQQVQDEDVSFEKEKDCANIGKRPIIAFRTATLFKIARLVFYKAMDPTLHYKMKAEEVSDGCGNGFAYPT